MWWKSNWWKQVTDPFQIVVPNWMFTQQLSALDMLQISNGNSFRCVTAVCVPSYYSIWNTRFHHHFLFFSLSCPLALAWSHFSLLSLLFSLSSSLSFSFFRSLLQLVKTLFLITTWILLLAIWLLAATKYSTLTYSHTHAHSRFQNAKGCNKFLTLQLRRSNENHVSKPNRKAFIDKYAMVHLK